MWTPSILDVRTVVDLDTWQYQKQRGGYAGGWTMATGSPAREPRGRLQSLMYGPSSIWTHGNIRSREVKRSLLSSNSQPIKVAKWWRS
ncbi:hypothetical protein V6N13_018738 [Hibiscus sabdariffa]